MEVSQTPFLLPRNEDGFIDYKGIFKIIYTDLKQPYGTLDDLTVQEVSWLIEGHLEYKKDNYEMVSYAMKTAMASVMSGKDIRLFENEIEVENKDTVGEQISPREKREKDLAYLKETFGEL